MYNALVGSGYLGNEGMRRETAPGVPNALDTSSYTNLNGDPQTPLRNYARNQAQIGNIQASGSQQAADAVQGVREDARRQSQEEYDRLQFLNDYLARNLEKAEAGDDLIRLGMSMSPEEINSIMLAGGNFMRGYESQLRPSPTDGRGMIPGEPQTPREEKERQDAMRGVRLPRI